MFGFHPVNLAFRFLLELAAFAAIAVGSYSLTSGIASWVLAIGLPLLAAIAWGVFNVPGDKSRSGKAPVAVSGVVRLLVELIVFAAAVALLSSAWTVGALLLAGLVVVHYLLSIDRIRWLLAN